MIEQSPPAKDCTSMAEVREAIDALDGRIVGLLGERFRYVEAAARIKQSLDLIRDDERIEEVISNAGRRAEAARVPPQLVEQLYRVLIEGAIVYETERFQDKAAPAGEGP
jgi:isochorismate pyruvate lyase